MYTSRAGFNLNPLRPTTFRLGQAHWGEPLSRSIWQVQQQSTAVGGVAWVTSARERTQKPLRGLAQYASTLPTCPLMAVFGTLDSGWYLPWS
jgi:hypothetical protein